MSQRNRDKIKSLFFRPDGSSKLKTKETTFSVQRESLARVVVHLVELPIL